MYHTAQMARMAAYRHKTGYQNPFGAAANMWKFMGAYTLKGVYMYIYIHHMLYWKNYVIRNYNKM
jgi:hypothetical protein